jgi:hypothetical protein
MRIAIVGVGTIGSVIHSRSLQGFAVKPYRDRHRDGMNNALGHTSGKISARPAICLCARAAANQYGNSQRNGRRYQCPARYVGSWHRLIMTARCTTFDNSSVTTVATSSTGIFILNRGIQSAFKKATKSAFSWSVKPAEALIIRVHEVLKRGCVRGGRAQGECCTNTESLRIQCQPRVCA